MRAICRPGADPLESLAVALANTLKGHSDLVKSVAFSPEQKVALFRQHLVEKVPISEVCQKNGIAVNLFYLWQKIFFENGTAAFTAHDKRRKSDATSASWRGRPASS